MSEADILEAMMNSQALAMGAMMLYLSIVSGYLVVAYLIGAVLTRQQMLFISALFVSAAGFAIWGSVAYFWWGSYFLDMSATLDAATTESWVRPWAIIGVVECAGVAGCLNFMHNIRRATPQAAPFDALALPHARLDHGVDDVAALTEDGDRTERGVR